MGFSRQEEWNGLPFPSQGNLLNPGTEPKSSALAGGFLFIPEPPRIGYSFGCSVAKSCLTLCDPMDCSMPVLHSLPELAQTPVHWVSDPIQPSHPLLPPSLFALSLSQHQGLFPMNRLFSSGGQSIGASVSATVLPMNIQDWFPLWLTGLISFLSKRFSNTPIQKKFFLKTISFFLLSCLPLFFSFTLSDASHNSQKPRG